MTDEIKIILITAILIGLILLITQIPLTAVNLHRKKVPGPKIAKKICLIVTFIIILDIGLGMIACT